MPEFLGNRAPFADPHARAVISGLGMESDEDSLAALYIAGVCGLGYGLRQIVETQEAHGLSIRTISISGGAGAHPLTRQLLADATNRTVEVIDCPEPVLLGSAMLGAAAAKLFDGLKAAMPAMSHVGARCEPDSGVRALHDARYSAFLRLQETARSIREAEAAAA